VQESVDQSAWAKARGLAVPYSLINHLLDTAAIAAALWDRYLTAGQRVAITSGLGLGVDESRAKEVVCFCAGVHDIGKLSPAFARCDAQAWQRVSSALRGDDGAWSAVSHDAAGMRVLPDLLAELGYGVEVDGEDAGWKIAQIVGGHHGCYCDLTLSLNCSGPIASEGLGGQVWAAQRRAHLRLVHSVLGNPAPPPAAVSVPAAILVTGLVILADWLASQEGFITARQADLAPDAARHFARSLGEANSVLAAAGLDGLALGWKSFDFQGMFGIAQPNPLQQAVLDQLPAAVGEGPGILVVTTSMGDGKTELALCAERILALHSGSEGFFLGLPTMATSDQMYLRVREYAETITTGPASVTLAHSMAWLNEAYQAAATSASSNDPLVTAEVEGSASGGSRAAQARTAASQWLRGAKRPMLARIGVGTFDQALAAVLPVRHNVLRLLALSGRTLIIDEAHACDPYMQVLLQRLLTWLAAFGCPVILLSATLPGSVADRYVRAYLRGAGHSVRALPKQRYSPGYPGWIYVDAKSAKPVVVDKDAAERQAAERETALVVEVKRVRHHTYSLQTASSTRALPERSRFAAIEEQLRPLVEFGGTAAVVCTTVADAQQTYQYVRDVVFAGVPGCDTQVELLHARLPAADREQRAQRIVTALGKRGPRPERMVVIATQVIEQSLDIDVDLLVSDLAPISLLLQRAGRCWRHERRWVLDGRPRPRPAWSSGPRLVVLVPSGDSGALAVPRAWGSVYHAYLLEATDTLLAERCSGTISLPGDVQGLVEAVYGERSAFVSQAREIDEASFETTSRLAWDGEVLAQRTIADCRVIPRPRDVASLARLHDRSIDDEDIGTRLGVDSVRVVCCYRRGDGVLTLDPDGRRELPAPDARGRFSTEQIRAVLSRSIPIASRYLDGRDEQTEVPAPWTENPTLADLVLLPHERDRAGVWQGPMIGRRRLELDDRLGLVID
jgi:CRISPR-associated endonuclease/helicase Cas3